MSIAERDAHQKLLIKIISKLEQWIDEGELRAAPSAVYIDPEHKVKPDIFWVSADNERCYLDDSDQWVGAPDLVIEILSPGTEAIDRGRKFHIYETNRVFEYWLVNPDAGFVETYVLLNKRFTRHGLYQPGETFSSGVLNGRTIDVSELFGHHAPDTSKA
jgi:Uma2 family endonuclease